MIAECLKEKKLIIYGTGHVAHKFYRALEEHQLQRNVQCFVRTGAAGDNEMFEGIPVYSFHDIPIEKQSLVCLAVHECLRSEIEQRVRQKTQQLLWVYPYLYELMLGEPKQTGVELDVKLLLESFRHDLRLGVRLAAIEQRDGKNTYGFDCYIQAQMLHCSRDTAIQRLKQFLELTDRWRRSGYENRYAISVNQNYEVIDGNHRVALAIYTGQQAICGDIYPNKLSAEEIHGQAAMLSPKLLAQNGFVAHEIKKLETIQQRYWDAYRNGQEKRADNSG